MEYAIVWDDWPCIWYYTSRLGHPWANFVGDAARWKTEKAAQNHLDKVIHWAKSKDKSNIKIIQVKIKEKVKFDKPKLTINEKEDKKNKIVKSLLKQGWKPNHKYQEGLDQYGFGEWGDGYLIDSDERFAITLKSNVMTVHDASRAYCKVISMAYNEIEIKKNELLCGRVALKV